MKFKGMTNNQFLRYALLAVGFCSTGLAILGIFLPLLPTVPLLLLAAACFARSSERFHNWLHNHQKLGPIIRDYLSGQGIPLRSKITAIVFIWFSISISVFVINPYWLKTLLVIIGFSVTLYLLSLTTSNGI